MRPTCRSASPTVPTPPKYKGPNGESWAGGRGRMPDWELKVIVNKGEVDLDEYRIGK